MNGKGKYSSVFFMANGLCKLISILKKLVSLLTFIFFNSLNSVILIQGYLPMQGTSEIFWRHFWLPYWEGRNLVGKTKDDAKHFTIYRKTSHNKDYDPAQNVTSAAI